MCSRLSDQTSRQFVGGLQLATFVLLALALPVKAKGPAAPEASSQTDASIRPAGHPVSFPAPWTSPFHVDPQRPHQLVNAQGHHLFILNKTAWAYFLCKDPEGVLDRAAAQGVNVLRVALEGAPYYPVLQMALWPWKGTRQQPDFVGFDETYWNQVEQRIRLAGQKGIGLDIVLYMDLHPQVDQVEQQRPYWRQALQRLGKYANVLTWEIANEYTANGAFQDVAG
jgi:hypothetical protein